MPLMEIAIGIGQEQIAAHLLPLLRELIGVQDRQLQALEAIRQDIQTLRRGPWLESQQLLEMAASSEGSVRRGYLVEARAALFRAHSHEPLPTPSRATISIDLAMVLGLLGEVDGALTWALKAHNDQVIAVNGAAEHALAALNSPVHALLVFVDGDFWELVDRSLRGDPIGARVWLYERYELGLEEPDFDSRPTRTLRLGGGSLWANRAESARQAWLALSGLRGAREARAQLDLWYSDSRARLERGENIRPWGKKTAHIAIAATLTEGGRSLIELHRMRRDADEYRSVAQALRPGLQVQEYKLNVDLSHKRSAVITWGPTPAG